MQEGAQVDTAQETAKVEQTTAPVLKNTDNVVSAPAVVAENRAGAPGENKSYTTDGANGMESHQVDSNGSPVEKLNSAAEITDEDFTVPYRSVELPAIPQRTLDLIGRKAKPVLIKKNIFEKNKENHKELTAEQSRNVLNRALYDNDLVGNVKAKSKPNYWVAVNLGDKNAVVVFDVTETKTHHEVVGWRLISKDSLGEMEKQAAREGAQFLITKDLAASGASGLHAVTNGSTDNVPQVPENANPDAENGTS